MFSSRETIQTNPQRILVVDDEESFADVVAGALTSGSGFQAIACYSGRAAIHLLKTEKGVYKRYLFRKEKERLAQQSGEFEIRAAAVETFHAAAASIAHQMKNALTFLELRILNQEYALKQFVPLESTPHIEKAFADLRTEFKVITTGFTALADFLGIIAREPLAMSEVSKLQEDVQKKLADLIRLSSTVAWNEQNTS